MLIGPPGTGKSQSIANIIADMLSQGRTVLFVAEKRAALEVVQRHMERIGLADFCLDLFSPKSNKAQVVAQMARAQAASEDFDHGGWQNATVSLAGLRAELNGYVRELHRRGRNGWTPFRAMGLVLRGEGRAVPSMGIPWPGADTHDAADYQRLAILVEDAAAVLARVGDITAAAALAGVDRSDWSPPWETRLLDGSRVLSARRKSLTQAAIAVRRALGLAADDNPDGQDLSRPAILALKGLADALLNPIVRQAA